MYMAPCIVFYAQHGTCIYLIIVRTNELASAVATFRILSCAPIFVSNVSSHLIMGNPKPMTSRSPKHAQRFSQIRVDIRWAPSLCFPRRSSICSKQDFHMCSPRWFSIFDSNPHSSSLYPHKQASSSSIASGQVAGLSNQSMPPSSQGLSRLYLIN